MVFKGIGKVIAMRGFALPTVLIASIVMLMVLLSGLVSVSSINTVLRNQYQDQALRLASEAGVVKVNACLVKSYGTVTWTDAKPLKPNTDCNGDTLSGVNAYVLETSAKSGGPITTRTTFEVPALVVVNNSQRANIKATLFSYRSSTGAQTAATVLNKSALIGSQVGFSNVTFGYCFGACGGGGGSDGAQLAVVLATGEVKGLGENSNGRLGNGTLTDSLKPSLFTLPGSEKGVAAFSNFLSVGSSLAVLTASGKVYSSGGNEYGQLGNPGAGTSNPISTPVQFGTIGNSGQPKAKFVSPFGLATFVMADDNKIYAAGNCGYSLLGTGCTANSTATPGAVALPTPTSDLNTIPETTNDWTQATNLTVDRYNAAVRMKGGAVYTWGINDYGQIGDGTLNTATTPKRLQGLSVMKNGVTPYNPSAVQVAHNGISLYMVDADGLAWAVGGDNASYGQLAGAGALIRNKGNTTACIDNNTGNTYIVTANCNSDSGWQFMEWWPDGTWRFRTDSRSYTPTDNMKCATAPSTLGNTSYIQLLPCTGGADQKWETRTDSTIRSLYTGGCVEPYNNLYVISCTTSDYQKWAVQNSAYLRPIPVPPGNPKAVRVSTDFAGVVILYDNGEAWASGANIRGHLGNGASNVTYGPMLKKVIVPAGRKIVDIYTTEAGPWGGTVGLTGSAYNNSYFILDDGTVYGSGSNYFGQLGNGATSEFEATPVKMNLPAGVIAKSVQAGYGTAVILSSTGKVFTVGNNSNGQLGDGTTTSSSTPRANEYTNQRSTITY